jgi:hypothetical protein
MKPERALWMPIGSVRAIGFLTVLGLIVYLSIFDKAVDEYVQNLINLMVGFYFGNKVTTIAKGD